MNKVILVDDEFLVRVRLKACVDWNELGFEIAGEAGNGEDALALVEEVHPKLAIVDINMPFINGLDFAEIVHEKYPDLKVIVLTGYSSFDYARGALQAGVLNYLLKPVIPDELKKSLLEIKEKIDQETQLKENIERLQVNSRERITLLKQKYIQSLLDGVAPDLSGNGKDKFKLFCPGLEDCGLVVAVISIDGLIARNVSESDKDLWRFAVSNIFSEIFERENCYEISYDLNGQIVLIVNTKNWKMGNSIVDYVALCETAKDFVKEYLQITVTIGISKVHSCIKEIGASYKEAVTAIKNKLVLGNDRIISFQSIGSNTGIKPNNINFRQVILINLRLGNTKEVLDTLHKIFVSFMDKGLLIDSLYMVISELLLTVTTFAQENDINLSELTEDITIMELIESKENIIEIENWFCDLMNNMIQICSNRRNMGHTRIVDKVIIYIDKNYVNNQLSLENIASNMSINASHLSNIFKKESGVSITEYLTECRMKHAKELIDSGNKKLFEIAELVGFNDPYYFSKCFKKTFGVSASKYFKNK